MNTLRNVSPPSDLSSIVRATDDEKQESIEGIPAVKRWNAPLAPP
jgi:hypothetical protein